MLNRNLLTIALLAGVACAQTAPAKATTTAQKKTSAPTTPASQTVKSTSAPSKTEAKPVATPKKETPKAPTTTAKKTAPAKVQSPAKVKADIQAKAAKPSAEKPEPVKTAGRRDPFVSPLRLQEDKIKNNSLCTTGAKCLVAEQVVLKGIVKTPQGMIAMVENGSQKQYNLREKDPVYNGQVVKITGDSVIFRETITDNLGHQTTREVVKKVTAPVL
jgi:Tfp pilus assembly protein PilP